MPKKILIIAGEASGDLHASNLLLELKKQYPDLYAFGLGGEKLKNAGAEIMTDLTKLAVVGFFEILKNYWKFRRIFYDVLKKTDAVRPDAAILVDYPGFNLKLAAELKKRGIKIIYFISPQVWAWGKKRVDFIRSHIDLMLVLFKFEEILYGGHVEGGFKVRFVGHPLLDAIKPTKSAQELLDEFGLRRTGRTIALLPGSRMKEVTQLLPVMLKSAQIIFRKEPQAQFLICRAPTIPRQIVKDLIDAANIDFPYKVMENETYNGLEASDFAIVASGTATLETAILNKPMVIVYKTSLLTWFLARLLIKIPYIGLVNVVAGEKIVPELVQFDATPRKIASTVLAILGDKQKMEKIHAELYALKNTLGIPGACQRAAEEIAEFLG
ncbi:lipid-A-disaccharide synthase [Candidatus Velamenicoccus archaeovorus]|uniref:Lipid-A-disaccharide synthase n=1 Tax=Velamenicoccus archaeovorus TaxID=1930593 RepID=A0A410P2F0_VELA1|nr:lipid-A-disaccharide synthase [Candidatus Velamenicoccus archaeovorus]QAT16377.1 lipid-A-disaccharide synthase [Candidatus Velamenicoccus archaeovorus]